MHGEHESAQSVGGVEWCGDFTRGREMEPEDLKKLVTRKMPFGKHQGWLIADLPGPYLNWFAREGFPDGEIGRLLALMQEIDHNGLSPLLEPLR
jgi:uncharacterized protein (DUF3820 family)